MSRSPHRTALHYTVAKPGQVAGVAVLASAANLTAHRGLRPWWLVRFYFIAYVEKLMVR